MKRILVFVGMLWVCLAPAPARAHDDLIKQIAAATRQIECSPGDATLYLKRGRLFDQHEQSDAAIADFERARFLDPSLAAADLARAATLSRAGFHLSARAILDAYLTRRPDDGEALVVRARVLASLALHVEASADFTRAISLLPDVRPDLYVERAASEAAAGGDHVGSALEGLDEGIGRFGPLVVLQRPAIELELRRANFDGALARLETLSVQSARHEGIHVERGRILVQAGRVAEAADAYSAALVEIEALPARLRRMESTLALKAAAQDGLARLATPAASGR